MTRDVQTIGGCPTCKSDLLTCKYNLFESDDLRIDSWEHRCPDCGHRDTTAYRSDDEDADPAIDPLVCPYCARNCVV